MSSAATRSRPWRATAPDGAATAGPSGMRASGQTSRSGSRTNLRSSIRGCGTVSPGSEMIHLSARMRSRSYVLGPQRVSRTRPRERSITSNSRSRPRGVCAVSITTTALRNEPWSGPPIGVVSYTEETAAMRETEARPSTAALRCSSRSPRLDPAPIAQRVTGPGLARVPQDREAARGSPESPRSQ